MKKYALVTIIGLITLLSCHKEDETHTVGTLLAKNSWKMSEWTSSPAYPIYFTNGTSESFVNQYDSYKRINSLCELTRIMSFTSAGNNLEAGDYSIEVGTADCGNKRIMEKSRWQLTNTATGINVTLIQPAGNPDKIDNFTIMELKPGKLVIKYHLGRANGANGEFDLTQTFLPL